MEPWPSSDAVPGQPINAWIVSCWKKFGGSLKWRRFGSPFAGIPLNCPDKSFELPALVVAMPQPVQLQSAMRRLFTGTLWTAIGAVGARCLSVVGAVLAARLLGREDFGALGIVQSTVGMFGVLAGFGLGATSTRHIAQLRLTDPVRAGRILTLCIVTGWGTSLLMAGAMAGAAPWLSARILARPDLCDVIRIGAWMLFWGGVNGMQMGTLAGLEAFRTTAWINMVVGLTGIPMTVLGIYWGGLRGGVWGLVAASVLNWTLNHIMLRRLCARANLRLTRHGWWEERAVLTRFSIPSMLSVMMVGPVWWACQAILVNQADGYAQLGLFNAAARIKQLPESIAGLLMVPLMPILSDLHGRRDVEGYGRILRAAFGIYALVIVPVSLLQAAVPSLTLMPFGSEYSTSPGLVRFLMLHAVMVGLYAPLGQVIASAGRMWVGFFHNLAWGIICLLLAGWLIPAWGAAGLAASQAVAFLCVSLPFLWYLNLKDRDLVRNLPLFRWTGIALFALVVVVWFPSDVYPGWSGIGGLFVGIGFGSWMVYEMRTLWNGLLGVFVQRWRSRPPS